MNPRSLIVTFGLATLLTLAACGGEAAPTPTPAPPTPAGDIAKGKQLFTATCVSCHGPEAKGIKGLGKDLTASEFVKGQSVVDLSKFLAKGRPSSDPLNTTKVDMPPKGGNPALKDEDLINIAAFIHSLQK